MDDNELDDIQERNLTRLVSNNAFSFSDTFFPYTSGEIGPYYVNSEVVQANGKDYAKAVLDMQGLIIDNIPADKIDVISGGESRDWVFSFPIAVNLQKPHFMIYKDRKVKGGTNVDGKYVVHVADLSNQGSSPRDKWVPTIREQGGTIEHIFFYVDRMEEGVKVMEDLGLQSHAIIPLNENAWDYLQKSGVVDNEVYKNLRERGTTKEERDAWAINMLRSDAGIKTYRELARTNREKARKIIFNPSYKEVHDILYKELSETI